MRSVRIEAEQRLTEETSTNRQLLGDKSKFSGPRDMSIIEGQ